MSGGSKGAERSLERPLDGGLGHAATRPLQVLWAQPGMLGDARQDAWPKFLAIMKREHEVRPTFTCQRAMRARLSLELPADASSALKTRFALADGH
jgi:hypothetical protein